MKVALLAAILPLAQAPADLPADPEDIGVVHFLQGGRPVHLEMRRATKRNARGISGSRKSLVVEGDASTVRFRAGEIPTFVVTVLLPMQLPTNWELHPLVRHDNTKVRSLTVFDDGPFDAFGSPGLHLLVRRYGPNSFLLIPSQPLVPGEYGFKYGLTPYESKDVYCFGVDLPRPGASSRRDNR